MSIKKVVKKSTRTSKKVVTLADFDSLLRDGLTSSKSYVVLKQKSRSPVYLAFKPIISRINQSVFYIGGKLSAFPNGNHEAWSGIDYQGKLEILKKAFKALPSDRVSEKRIGSHVGVFISGGQRDFKKLMTKLEVKKVIKTILDGIQKKLDIEIENRTDVAKFLNLTFEDQLKFAFHESYGASLPTRQLGKVSEVQFGQSKAYGYSNPSLQEFIDEFHLKPMEAEAA